MPLNYVPNRDAAEASNGGSVPEGEYTFKVDEASEETFRSGNEGLKIKLLVAATEVRDVTSFDNLMYLDSCAWKMKQFLESVGRDYYHPPEVHELVNLTGRANFVHNEKGYITPGEYLPASANNAPGPMPPSGGYTEANPPPAMDEPPL